MSAVAPSLEKMNDTVQKLRGMVEKMDTYNQAELNQIEDRIRNEFQVIEAMIAYVGRDIYSLAQKRRMELRNQNIADVKRAVEYLRTAVVEEDHGTRSSGNTGDGNGADKPRRAKRKSDK